MIGNKRRGQRFDDGTRHSLKLERARMDKSSNNPTRTASRALGGALVAWFCLAAPVAHAQDESPLVDSASLVTDAAFDRENISGRVWTANIASCRQLLESDDELTFRWELKTAYTDQTRRYAIKLQRPGGSCDTNSAGQENTESCTFLVTNETVGNKTLFEAKIRPSRLFDLTGADDCFTESDGAYDMMLVLPRVTVLDDEKKFEPDVVRVRLDTERPEPPPGTIRVTGGERSLSVRWDEAVEADRYRVYVSQTPFSAGELPEVITDATTTSVSSTSANVTGGISANQTYYVGVVSIDESKNESVISAVATVTTQPTVDFWEAYKSAGGREQGGHCAQAGASPGGGLWALGLLAMLWSRRRRGSR